MAEACSSRLVTSFVRPQVSQNMIEVEALWASFVVEHNLAFMQVTMLLSCSQKCFLTLKLQKISLWTYYTTLMKLNVFVVVAVTTPFLFSLLL